MKRAVRLRRSVVRALARPWILGRNVAKYVLLYDPSIRSQHFGREHMAGLAACFIKANAIRGSYLEFGVFQGSTFAQFYHTFRRHRLDVPMFGFDSFEGMPQARGRDADPQFRRYPAGYFFCSEADTRTELAQRWVPPTAYTLVPGVYEQSLQSALYQQPGISPVALVWVDCLYYESARAVLRFVGPILQNGTVLMFNSYFRYKAHPDYGERRALTEWSRDNPTIGLTEYAKFATTGLALITHLPEQRA